MSYKKYFSFPIFIVLIFNVSVIFCWNLPELLDPPDDVDLRTVSSQWFTQKLDHFSPTDGRAWQQRYFVNDAYYNESSKNNIYLMLGGETAASALWVNYGAWMDTVGEYGGLLLYLEHRFYGESMPLSDLSTKNLLYLSTEQALEDVASFIQGIDKEYNLSSEAKWIVYGASYAGSLAAWMRQRYPHLVAGAVSSSAPLEATLDFYEYLEVVVKGLSSRGQTCVDSIKAAYAQLEDLVSSCLEDAIIYSDLNEAFNFCDSIETSEGIDKDLNNLFELITDSNFAYVVQYEGIPGARVSIEDVCDLMTSSTSGVAELYRLGEVNRLLQNRTGVACTDYKYDSTVKNWQDIVPNKNSMMRQWYYQTCSQFGYFQTSSQQTPIFGSRFNISFFTSMCQDIFGPDFNETLTNSGIEAINNRYGGKDIEASNVVYVHGSIDPWHVLGKLESTDGSGQVIIIEGASHSANMYPEQPSDSTSLKQARKEINRLVGQWLGVNNENNGRTSASNSFTVFICIFICLYQLI